MGTTRFVVAVEAAVYRDGRYLLIRRSRSDADAPGILALPGGKVEIEPAGEAILENSVHREVSEETGVEIESAVHFVQSKNFTLDEDRHVVDVIFLCRYLSGTARPDGIETEAVLWLTAAELSDRSDVADWLKRSIARAEARRLALGWP